MATKMLAALAACALAGLVSCASPAGDKVVLHAPDGRTTTLHRQTARTHTESDGIALSPDGTMALVAAMGRPADELLLVSLGEGRATRMPLAAPDGRILDPAFSSDGRRFVAVVDPQPAAPNFDRGPSQILVADTARSGVVTVLAADGRRRRHPALSPDGRRIAYFRSLDPPGQLAQAYGLFEYDLASGAERRVARQAFAIPGQIFYHPAGAGLFYAAVDPLDAAAEGADRWVPGSGLTDWPDIGYAADFWLAQGAEIPRRPQPLTAPTAATRGARVIGVTAAGDPILMSQVGVGVVRDGAFVQAFALDPAISLCSTWAPNADATAYVANANCAAGDPMNLHYVPSTIFVWRGGRTNAIPFTSLTIDAEPRLLR